MNDIERPTTEAGKRALACIDMDYANWMREFGDPEKAIAAIEAEARAGMPHMERLERSDLPPIDTQDPERLDGWTKRLYGFYGIPKSFDWVPTHPSYIDTLIIRSEEHNPT